MRDEKSISIVDEHLESRWLHEDWRLKEIFFRFANKETSENVSEKDLKFLLGAAIKNNDEVFVKNLIKAKPDLNEDGDMNFIALAASSNYMGITVFLLEHYKSSEFLARHILLAYDSANVLRLTATSNLLYLIKLRNELAELKQQSGTYWEKRRLSNQRETLWLRCIFLMTYVGVDNFIKFTAIREYLNEKFYVLEGRYTLFQYALYMGDYILAEKLSDMEEIDITIKDELGRTPRTYLEACLLNIQKQGSPDPSQINLLQNALFNIKYKELKLLRKNLSELASSRFQIFYRNRKKYYSQCIDNLEHEVLKEAIERENQIAVEELLAATPTLLSSTLDNNKTIGLLHAIRFGNRHLVETFLKGSYCLVTHKVWGNARQCTEALVDRAGDEKEKMSFYSFVSKQIDDIICAEYQKMDNAKWLSEVPSIDYIDNLKFERLRLACINDEKEILDSFTAFPELLGRLIDRICNDNRETLLILAAKHGSVQAVDWLLKNHANIYANNHNAQTALETAKIAFRQASGAKKETYLQIIAKLELSLHERRLEDAIINNDLPAVKQWINSLLVKKSIGVNDMTPLELAERYQRKEIIHYLLRFCGAADDENIFQPSFDGEIAQAFQQTFEINLLTKPKLIALHTELHTLYNELIARKTLSEAENAFYLILKQLFEISPKEKFVNVLEKLSPHQKVDVYTLLHSIKRLAALGNRIEIETEIKRLFKARAGMIRDTDLDYPADPQTLGNQWCYALAKMLFPQQEPYNVLLAPALTENRPFGSWNNDIYGASDLDEADKERLPTSSRQIFRTANDECHLVAFEDKQEDLTKGLVPQAIQNIKDQKFFLHQIWVGSDNGKASPKKIQTKIHLHNEETLVLYIDNFSSTTSLSTMVYDKTFIFNAKNEVFYLNKKIIPSVTDCTHTLMTEESNLEKIKEKLKIDKNTNRKLQNYELALLPSQKAVYLIQLPTFPEFPTEADYAQLGYENLYIATEKGQLLYVNRSSQQRVEFELEFKFLPEFKKLPSEAQLLTPDDLKHFPTVGSVLEPGDFPGMSYEDLMRLSQYSPTLGKLVQYTVQLHQDAINTMNPLVLLQQVKEELRQSDYRHNGGDHNFAGPQAYLAVIKLATWFNALPPQSKIFIKSLGVGKMGKNLEILLDPANHQNRNNATYCMHLRANALQTLLEEKEIKKALSEMIGSSDELRRGVTDEDLDKWQQQISKELDSPHLAPAALVGRGISSLAAGKQIIDKVRSGTSEEISYENLMQYKVEDELTEKLKTEIDQLFETMESNNQHTNRKKCLEYIVLQKDNSMLARILSDEGLGHRRFESFLRKHNRNSLCTTLVNGTTVTTSESWMIITIAINLKMQSNNQKQPEASPKITVAPENLQLIRDLGIFRRRNVLGAIRETGLGEQHSELTTIFEQQCHQRMH